MHARLTVLCVLLAIAHAADVFTQSRPAAFDVVSVKHFKTDAGRPGRGDISVLPGGRFSAPSATLRGLIIAAYGLLDIQVVDAGRQLGQPRIEPGGDGGNGVHT